MNLDTNKLKIARRLNGGLINGYTGYYGHITEEGSDFLIIAIPHNPMSIDRLMDEIEIKV